jgi:hypothetical protein
LLLHKVGIRVAATAAAARAGRASRA